MALTLYGKPTATTATCNYTAGSFTKPSGASNGTWADVNGTLNPSVPTYSTTKQTKIQEKTVVTIGDIKYKWSFDSTTANGRHVFQLNNLNEQRSQTLTATVKATCEKKTQKKRRVLTRTRTAGNQSGTVEPGPWSAWSYGDEYNYGQAQTVDVNAVPASRSYSLTVYAKPKTFSWNSGVESDKTIETSAGLTASKWNELVTKVGQRKNWEAQSSGHSYSSAEVNAGDLITATIFNIIAGALGLPGVSGGKTGTIISAQLFKNLATAVNA